MPSINKISKYLTLLFATIFITLVSTSYASAEVNENIISPKSEQELNKLLEPYFEKKEEINKLDYVLKDSLYHQLIDLQDVKVEEINFSEEKNFYKNNGKLVEVKGNNVMQGFSILSNSNTIPESDLSLRIMSSVLSNGDVAMFGDFEWKKRETAPDEYVGLSVTKDFNVVPQTHSFRVYSRTSTSNSWSTYYPSSRPYEASLQGEMGSFSGNSQYYKGTISFRVRPQNTSPNNTAKISYFSNTSGGGSLGFNIGPLSFSQTSGSAPKKAESMELFTWKRYY